MTIATFYDAVMQSGATFYSPICMEDCKIWVYSTIAMMENEDKEVLRINLKYDWMDLRAPGEKAKDLDTLPAKWQSIIDRFLSSMEVYCAEQQARVADEKRMQCKRQLEEAKLTDLDQVVEWERKWEQEWTQESKRMKLAQEKLQKDSVYFLYSTIRRLQLQRVYASELTPFKRALRGCSKMAYYMAIMRSNRASKFDFACDNTWCYAMQDRFDNFSDVQVAIRDCSKLIGEYSDFLDSQDPSVAELKKYLADLQA